MQAQCPRQMPESSLDTGFCMWQILSWVKLTLTNWGRAILTAVSVSQWTLRTGDATLGNYFTQNVINFPVLLSLQQMILHKAKFNVLAWLRGFILDGKRSAPETLPEISKYHWVFKYCTTLISFRWLPHTALTQFLCKSLRSLDLIFSICWCWRVSCGGGVRCVSPWGRGHWQRKPRGAIPGVSPPRVRH